MSSLKSHNNRRWGISCKYSCTYKLNNHWVKMDILHWTIGSNFEFGDLFRDSLAWNQEGVYTWNTVSVRKLTDVLSLCTPLSFLFVYKTWKLAHLYNGSTIQVFRKVWEEKVGWGRSSRGSNQLGGSDCLLAEQKDGPSSHKHAHL